MGVGKNIVEQLSQKILNMKNGVQRISVLAKLSVCDSNTDFFNAPEKRRMLTTFSPRHELKETLLEVKKLFSNLKLVGRWREVLTNGQHQAGQLQVFSKYT